jgi:hypothetical protein
MNSVFVLSNTKKPLMPMGEPTDPRPPKADPAPDTLPLFDPDPTEGEHPRPVSVDAEIARLRAESQSWQQIADDLNARGFHTATGAPFHKGALHRLWKQRQPEPTP